MKSEKGITLISLIVYVIVLTIVVAVIAIVSGFFMKNIKKADFYTDPLTGKKIAPDVGWSYNPAADF